MVRRKTSLRVRCSVQMVHDRIAHNFLYGGTVSVGQDDAIIFF